jgi:hypothetical protein
MTRHQNQTTTYLPALNQAWYRAGRNSNLPMTKYRLKYWNFEMGYYLMMGA